MRRTLTLLLTSAAATAEPKCPVKRTQIYIQGESMAELYGKSRRNVETLEGWYTCHAIRRGDVVIVKNPLSARPLIKSVLILPGDRFEVRTTPEGAFIWVNGERLKTPRGEDYLFSLDRARTLKRYEQAFGGRVAENFYFVFGTMDHGSVDSSLFGPVLRSAVIGKVTPRTR